jgi:prevent-host-death family protein
MERRVSIRELNQRTSAVLHEVAGGVAITITSDGRPVARLVPIGGASSVLAALVAAGRARAPTLGGAMPMPPVCGSETLDVAALLVAGREDRL